MIFYIHSGYPKNGSSLIQESLQLNRNYLTTKGWNVFTYHNLHDHIFFKTARDIMFDIIDLEDVNYNKIIKSMDTSKNIVISFEDFFFVPKNIFKHNDLYYNTSKIAQYISFLCKALNFKSEILFFSRDKESWLESFYIQTIQKGKSWSYTEFLNSSNLESFNNNELINIFESRDMSCSIEDFSIIKNGQDFFLDFFYSKIGINYTELKSIKQRINPSYSHEAVEISRVANKILSNRDDKYKFRKFLQENFSNITHDSFMSDKQSKDDLI